VLISHFYSGASFAGVDPDRALEGTRCHAWLEKFARGDYNKKQLGEWCSDSTLGARFVRQASELLEFHTKWHIIEVEPILVLLRDAQSALSLENLVTIGKVDVLAIKRDQIGGQALFRDADGALEITCPDYKGSLFAAKKNRWGGCYVLQASIYSLMILQIW
jgi:hypothetical protein